MFCLILLWSRYVKGATANVDFDINRQDENVVSNEEESMRGILKNQAEARPGSRDSQRSDRSSEGNSDLIHRKERKKKKKKKKKKKDKKTKKKEENQEEEEIGEPTEDKDKDPGIDADDEIDKKLIRDPKARRDGEMNVLLPKGGEDAKIKEIGEKIEDEMHQLKAKYSKEVENMDRRTSNFQFAEKLGVK